MRQGDMLIVRPAIRRGLVFFSILITCCSLLISGCGWHLRGSYEFPPSMARIYLDGTARYSKLGVAIHSAFQGTNSQLVSDRQQATAILRIHADKADQRILSTDKSGRASEYEISYLLSFKVEDITGMELVSEQQVSTRREHRFDPANVLATGGEVEQLKQDMVRSSVQQMLRQINTGLRSK